MLDNVLRIVFRNFSTLFLVVAMLIVPVHLAYSFIYKDVAQVEELHPYIENLPRGRQVQNVGRAVLAEARRRFVWVTVAQALLLPLLAGATRRVVGVDAAGGLPGVIDAYRHLLSKRVGPARRTASWGPRLAAVASGVVLALVIGWLVQTIGFLFAEVGPDGARWLIAGMTRATAFAAAAPFALVPLVALTGDEAVTP
ncbi:MAG: hypothetical protein M3346_04540 [Actinomycetota bacterium]|nr:hypothetical protein [Actinomycetota bacterium]